MVTDEIVFVVLSIPIRGLAPAVRSREGWGLYGLREWEKRRHQCGEANLNPFFLVIYPVKDW